MIKIKDVNSTSDERRGGSPLKNRKKVKIAPWSRRKAKMMAWSSGTSVKHLITRALKLLEVLVQERYSGRRLVLLEPDGKIAREFPGIFPVGPRDTTGVSGRSKH